MLISFNQESSVPSQPFYEKCVDVMILITYIVQHALFRFLNSPPSKKKIFKGRIIKKTHNFAKFSELWKYVKCFRSNQPLVDPHKEIFLEKGLTSGNYRPYPKPHKGLCTGSGMLFLQKWFETKNIEEVAKIFEGGVPIEGAAYQEIYASLKEIYLPELTQKIENFIQNYPESLVLGHKFRAYEPLFSEINNFLQQGKRFENDNFFMWLKNRGKIAIKQEVYASLRIAIEKFCNQPLGDITRETTIFALAGLNAEVIHFESTPRNILESVSTLGPGAYKLTFPVLDESGKISDSSHAVEFIIDENGETYFYDPNCCIASVSQDKIQETVGRLFTAYTGFDYSRNLDGEAPGSLDRLFNLLAGRSNASFSPLTRGFDLLKITSTVSVHPN